MCYLSLKQVCFKENQRKNGNSPQRTLFLVPMMSAIQRHHYSIFQLFKKETDLLCSLPVPPGVSHTASLRIQSDCGKIRTRITPNTDTFYAVPILIDFSRCTALLRLSHFNTFYLSSLFRYFLIQELFHLLFKGILLT